MLVVHMIMISIVGCGIYQQCYNEQRSTTYQLKNCSKKRSYCSTLLLSFYEVVVEEKKWLYKQEENGCKKLDAAWRRVFLQVQSQYSNYDNRQITLNIVPKQRKKKNLDQFIQKSMNFDEYFVKDVGGFVEKEDLDNYDSIINYAGNGIHICTQHSAIINNVKVNIVN